MAHRGFLREEVEYLRSCVDAQQIKFNRLEWEFSKLTSNFSQPTENLGNSWQAARVETDFLNEDSHYQQGQIHDLNKRVNHMGFDLEKCIDDSHFSSQDRTELWRKVNELERKVNQFSQLHLNLKRAILAFGKRCTNILRVTLRLNNKVHSEDLQIKLLVD